MFLSHRTGRIAILSSLLVGAFCFAATIGRATVVAQTTNDPPAAHDSHAWHKDQSKQTDTSGGGAPAQPATPGSPATPGGPAAAPSKGVATTSVTPEQAKSAYELFKGLSGLWMGKSTKGWTEEITYKTIAGGSVVLEESFGAHPNEMMVTMIHPDSERLLLTHYCVAKNQPRLLLTGYEDEGRKLTFEFMDGTNLASRDQGHMDKVVFRFSGADRFTSQWTWYQKGKESWMEEIEHARKGTERAPGAETPAKPAGAGAK